MAGQCSHTSVIACGALPSAQARSALGTATPSGRNPNVMSASSVTGSMPFKVALTVVDASRMWHLHACARTWSEVALGLRGR
jgi:hypothetical protein